MPDLFDKIRELRGRDERRLQARNTDVETMLLLTKVSEEANETVEKYRRSRGWGTNGVTNAEPTEVADELCSTIMAGLVALDREMEANGETRGRGQSPPLLVDHLVAISAACPDNLTGLRDRASW